MWYLLVLGNKKVIWYEYKWYLLRLSKRNCCWCRLLFIVVIGKFVFVGFVPGINIMFYLSIINYKSWHLQCFSLIQWVTHCVCYFLYLAIFLFFSLSLFLLLLVANSYFFISKLKCVRAHTWTNTHTHTYIHIYNFIEFCSPPVFSPPSPPLLRSLSSWHTQVADGDGWWHVERKRKYFTSINDDDDDD